MQFPVLILIVAAVVVSYMSDNTKFGRHAYAIGGNREAARLSGINIQSNIFLIFVLMGFLCGVSGIVLASYVGYGTIAAGTGYELYAIAACILGGTSTLGGVGTIFGAMVGALIMASLTNGLQILNVPSAWQYVLKGLVLIVAVYADVYFKRTDKPPGTAVCCSGGRNRACSSVRPYNSAGPPAMRPGMTYASGGRFYV